MSTSSRGDSPPRVDSTAEQVASVKSESLAGEDPKTLESRLHSAMTLVASLRKNRDELQAQLDALRGPREEKEAQTDVEAKKDEAPRPSSGNNSKGKKGEEDEQQQQDQQEEEDEEGKQSSRKVPSPPKDSASTASHIPAPRRSARKTFADQYVQTETVVAALTTTNSGLRDGDDLESPMLTARSRLKELRDEREAAALNSARRNLEFAKNDNSNEQAAEEIAKLSADLDAATAAAGVLEQALEEEKQRYRQMEGRLRGMEREMAGMKRDGAAVTNDMGQKQRELEEKLFSAEREAESERAMRRSLEAKYEEKLKLRAREVEALEQEVRRLKRAGDQLPPVLQELDRMKADAEERSRAKDGEVRRITAAFNATEAERAKLEIQVTRQIEEMGTWEARVKKAEEIRWRAGMELAKAKAELEWRQRSEQERIFHLERMKDEVERLKTKLMKAEMRKLKVEEALEECVIELRSKKREMEQMKLKVEGAVEFFSQQAHRPFLALAPPNVRSENNINYGDEHGPWY